MRFTFNAPLTWLFAVLLNVLPLFAQESSKKAVVPGADAQAEAAKLIKEVYGEEWVAAKTAALKQALAKTLLKKGKETEKDEAGRFVLFRLSRDIATQAGDAETAFQAIDELDQLFQIDPVEMKAVVLTKFVGTAKTAEQHTSLAEKAIALSDEALTKDRFAVARQLVELALGEARKARDKSLVQQISQRTAEIEGITKSYQAVKEANVTLNTAPADPDANLIVGKYKCLIKGDWDGGLPMLVLGNDQTLKALAVQELAGAASSTEQLKLGDGWWNLAEKQEGTTKKSIQGRAGYWYQKALPGLSGLVKDKVEKRLKRLSEAEAQAIGMVKPKRIVRNQMSVGSERAFAEEWTATNEWRIEGNGVRSGIRGESCQFRSSSVIWQWSWNSIVPHDGQITFLGCRFSESPSPFRTGDIQSVFNAVRMCSPTVTTPQNLRQL